MTFSYTYRKTVSVTTLIYLVSPMYLRPLTSTSEIVCMVSRRGYSTSHESHACGMPGVRFPRAVMTNLNRSPRKIHVVEKNSATICPFLSTTHLSRHPQLGIPHAGRISAPSTAKSQFCCRHPLRGSALSLNHRRVRFSDHFRALAST